MSGLTVNITGLRDLQRRLEQLATVEATKAGQSANRAGAKVLFNAIKAAAPVGPSAEGQIRTRRGRNGAIRQEVHRKIVNSLKLKKIRSNDINTVMNAITAGAAYHASFIEFGSIHNAPNPFMLNALNANEGPIIDAMKTVLNRQLIRRGV